MKLEERPSGKKELSGGVTWLEGTKGRRIYRWGVVEGDGGTCIRIPSRRTGRGTWGGRCKESGRKIARAWSKAPKITRYPLFGLLQTRHPPPKSSRKSIRQASTKRETTRRGRKNNSKYRTTTNRRIGQCNERGRSEQL